MFQRDEVKMMFVDVKESVSLVRWGKKQNKDPSFKFRSKTLYPIRPLDTFPK